MCAHFQGIAVQYGYQSGQGLIFDDFAALPSAANFCFAHARHSFLGSDYSGISTRRSLLFSRCGHLRVCVARLPLLGTACHRFRKEARTTLVADDCTRVRAARETVVTKNNCVQVTGNQVYFALGLRV